MRPQPISATVFGILNIGYAMWKFVGLLLAGVAMRLNLPGNSTLATLKSDPVYRAWSHVGLIVSVFFGIVLVASGIGLLLMKNWARLLAIIYSILEMIFVLAQAVFSQRVVMQAMTHQVHGPPPGLVAVFAQIGIVLGIVIGLAYPVLLLIFMTRPALAEAFRSAQAQEPL